MKNLNCFLPFRILLFFPLLLLASGILAQTTPNTGNSVVTSQNDSKLQWRPCPDFMPQGCTLAVLNGDPSKRNSDVLLKIPAGAAIQNHTHTSAERMILIEGELEVQYEGEEPKVIKTGSYAYGPAGKAHTAKCGNKPCTLFIAFEDPVDAFVAEVKKKN